MQLDVWRLSAIAGLPFKHYKKPPGRVASALTSARHQEHHGAAFTTCTTISSEWWYRNDTGRRTLPPEHG